MDYRKLYEIETGNKVPKSFDIHHLDLNRENNDISNLVAIPRDLHSKFHKVYNDLYIPDKNDIIPTDSFKTGVMQMCLNSVKEYERVYSDVIEWINYRDFLMGILPNIYNKRYYNE